MSLMSSAVDDQDDFMLMLSYLLYFECDMLYNVNWFPGGSPLGSPGEQSNPISFHLLTL